MPEENKNEEEELLNQEDELLEPNQDDINKMLNEIYNMIELDEGLSPEQKEKAKLAMRKSFELKTSKRARILFLVKKLVRSLIIRFGSIMIGFGFFMNQVVIEPKMLIILIAFIVSLISLMLSFASKRGEHGIIKYLFALLLLVVNLCLLNNYLPIFSSGLYWVALMVIVEAVVLIVNLYFIKRHFKW